MVGSILQVNISRGGVPKRPIDAGFLSPLGIEGDSHAHPQFHGGPRKAVLLICAEVISDLAARGFPIYPGALGENLTIQGIDHRQLQSGQRFRVGQAFIELTTVRIPCATLDIYGPSIKSEIYDLEVKAGNTASPKWAMSGFYAAVIRTGSVRQDDIIALVDQVV
jgi:MOSC domain-containing protein YiiM